MKLSAIVILTIVVCGGFSANVFAAGFSVSPVRVYLSAESSITSIKVSNKSDTPTLIQADAFLWEQKDGQEILVPTNDLLISPPIITIPPQKSQVVRLALRRPADQSKEMTYRIKIKEVANEVKKVNGFRMVMHVNMPVFVTPVEELKPVIEWSAVRLANNKVNLTLSNKGNAHIQVGRVQLLEDRSEKSLFDQTLATYVMPGQRRTWTLDLSDRPSAHRLILKAATDYQQVETKLSL